MKSMELHLVTLTVRSDFLKRGPMITAGKLRVAHRIQ